MAIGNVQRATVTDFGAGEDTVGKTISSAVATANSFARITNTMLTSGGPAAGVNASRFNDDLGCSCLLSDATTASLARYSTGVNEDLQVNLEVIELPGSGNDQAIVRMHQDITLANGVSTSDTAISGVTTIGDLVPIICGVRSGDIQNKLDRQAITPEIVDVSGAQIRLTRGDSSGEIIVSVAVVECVGSNWSVQQNIELTQSVEGATETKAISAVTWANTMIFSSIRSASPAIDFNMCAVWPGATTTTLRFSCNKTAPTTIAHLVSNPNLVVEHIDSITGSETNVDIGASNPTTVDKPVSTSVLADHFVVASSRPTTITGDTNNQKWGFDYYLTSTTNLRWWVTDGGTNNDIEWAAQLIDISGLGAVGTVEVADITTPVGHADAETISGSGFEAAQGTGSVVISPADDINDVGAVTQTIDSWANTSIGITVARGALNLDTNLYLFVKNDSGDSNTSGFVIQIVPNYEIDFAEIVELTIDMDFNVIPARPVSSRMQGFHQPHLWFQWGQ